MNPSGLKNLLIILFLSVNLFFLYKLTDLIEQKNRFRDEHVNEAVEILQTKGILIDGEDVIREKNVPKTLKLDWKLSTIEQTAKNLMKDSYGSFGIPDGHSFTGEGEALSFFYDYSLEYKRFDHSLTVDEVKKKLDNATGKNGAKKFEKLLGKLFSESISSDIGITVDSCLETDDIVYLEAHQTINGIKADGASFCAAIKNSEVIFISGKLYLCNGFKEYVTDSLDSINILFELEPSEKTIEKMEMLYYPVTENNEQVYLVPSYKFTYSNGDTVLYDAASGISRSRSD